MEGWVAMEISFFINHLKNIKTNLIKLKNIKKTTKNDIYICINKEYKNISWDKLKKFKNQEMIEILIKYTDLLIKQKEEIIENFKNILVF